MGNTNGWTLPPTFHSFDCEIHWRSDYPRPGFFSVQIHGRNSGDHQKLLQETVWREMSIVTSLITFPVAEIQGLPMTLNHCSCLPCLEIKVAGFSLLYLWRHIVQQASKSSEQMHLSTRSAHVIDFLVWYRCATLVFRRDLRPLTSCLRTKGNSFGCSITGVSHERGTPLQAAPICQSVLWAPPGGRIVVWLFVPCI